MPLPPPILAGLEACVVHAGLLFLSQLQSVGSPKMFYFCLSEHLSSLLVAPLPPLSLPGTEVCAVSRGQEVLHISSLAVDPLCLYLYNVVMHHAGTDECLLAWWFISQGNYWFLIAIVSLELNSLSSRKQQSTILVCRTDNQIRGI